MKIFSEIREFFWPLLEKGGEQKVIETDSSEIEVDSAHLEKVLDYTIKRYQDEDERRKSTESKSSLFIGTISVVTSVIIGITSVLINKEDFSLITCILVLLLFVLTIYMSRTIWFSVQTLERQNYYTISTKDFLMPDKGDEFYKKAIAKINNKILKNSVTINSKVDSMVLAQEYFKRSIVTVTLYAFVILLFFISKSKFRFNAHINTITDSLNGLSLSSFNIILIYLLILIILVTVVRLTIKLKNR